jgi:UDP-N-acetylmuramyl pentapeptide phosphotransferase/UDP-N-acetylglucosamine-1-phosphate transferase
MPWGPGIVAFAVAFIAAWLLAGRLARFALDRPNERSLHERPVPRTGGLAVLAGAASALFFGVEPLWLPMALAAALAALSLLDDLHGMPAGLRLAVHFAAAGLSAWYVLSPMHPLELAVLVLGVVWLTNLYNFMDGSDGLAGGMSVLGFGAYAAAAWIAGDAALAALCAAIAAASGAFLAHNFHPARIFLGDVGSIPLGFLAGALGLVGWRNDLWPLWFPLLAFGPFVGDATVTLLRRALHGERVWRAHRDHYYQRMVRMGLGHRGTALVAYSAMALCVAAALFGRAQSAAVQAAVFCAAAALLALAAVWVDWRWARFRRQQGASA